MRNRKQGTCDDVPTDVSLSRSSNTDGDNTTPLKKDSKHNSTKSGSKS